MFGKERELVFGPKLRWTNGREPGVRREQFVCAYRLRETENQ